MLFLGGACERRAPVLLPPPQTTIATVEDTLHGVPVSDDYRWLEDGHAAKTREWIELQNAYTDTMLAQIPDREELRAGMRDLVEVDRTGLPVEAGGRFFYVRYRAGDDLAILCMREGINGVEVVLVDPHGMSQDQSTSVSYLDVAKDGSLIAYAVRDGGTDEAHVRFMDVDQKRDLPEVLPTARYFSVEFTPDHRAVYYVRHDEAGPRLYMHRLKNGAVADLELFGGGYGPEYVMWATLSEDGRWMLVSVADGSTGPVSLHLKDFTKDNGWTTLIDDGVSRSYASFAGDNLVFLTNKDAPRWRVMKAFCTWPTEDEWREIIPEQEGRAIEQVQPVGKKLAVSMIHDAHYEAALYDLDGNRIRDIDFGVMGSIDGPRGKWESNNAFFGFSSYHIPYHIYMHDIATGENTVWFRSQVPVETDEITVEQVRYRSKDGTEIPMFLVHREDIDRDGSAPVLLLGYGGFGVQMTPRFSALATAMVNAGGVFAVPNLRGGGEFGEAWHEAGKRGNKQNTFDDFIAAAEHLIAEQYTRPERIAIYGGSNGGLLVGACMTQRPELFGAVVCFHPLLDMLRYHKFLVGQFWVTEFGSSEREEDFRYLHAYSPYHNVKKEVAYPATLFVTGETDTRVDPLHARKMTALLQRANAAETPILLRYHMRSGHAGGQPMHHIIDELVDVFSFLSWRVGLQFDFD
jgi:prolyl oligopeptidase